MKIMLGEIEIEVEGFWSEVVISPDGKRLKISQPIPPPIQYVQVPALTAPVPWWNTPIYPGIHPNISYNTSPPLYGTTTATDALPPTNQAIPSFTTGFIQPCDEIELAKSASCTFDGRVVVKPVAGETYGARVYTKPPNVQKATQS